MAKALLLFIAACGVAAGADAQPPATAGYPAKPVRIVVGFAPGGAGTGPHMAGELFKQMAGVDMLFVPYKGEGPALADLMKAELAKWAKVIKEAGIKLE